MPGKPYPTDVSDEEWSFAAPYLTLMEQHAHQREHDLREVFNALRWLVRAGAPWRMLPNDLPPWEAVYQEQSLGSGLVSCPRQAFLQTKSRSNAYLSSARSYQLNSVFR